MNLRKFKSLVNETGLDDLGASGITFEVDQMIKDKIYIQADQSIYDEHGRNSKPFFVDDNGCSRDIESSIKNGNVVEIFEENSSNEKYYIQNRDAGFMGNAIVFWRKGLKGYTVDLDNSEIFSEEEAAKICKGDPSKNKAWPVDYINKNKGIQRIIDSQYIFSEHIKNFE